MVTTEKRDLQSGNPVWSTAAADALPAEKLARDLSVDVLIVGGGFTGAVLAENLSRDFVVAVADRRRHGRGSTAASTGLLLYEIDVPLIKLRAKVGSELANRAWMRSSRAMRSLTQKFSSLGIECDFKHRLGVYLPGNVLSADELEIEAAARAELELPSYLIDRAELRAKFGLAHEAALVSENTGEASPVKSAAGLYRAAIANGARLLADTDIVKVQAGDPLVTAQTDAGATITANHLVFASGYEVPDYIEVAEHEIVSTWAYATKVQPRLWPERALIWEASDPYSYLRTTPDGRALIGGGDEDFDDEERRKAMTPEKLEELRDKLCEWYPHLDPEPEFVWSGAFGSSDTGLPKIGALPGWPNCYAVFGFGGNGMTYAEIGGELLGRLIRGETDPDMDIFAFPPEA